MGSGPLDGVIGGVIGSQTSRKEGKRMEQATQQATNIQQQQFDQMRSDTQPWRDAGVTALQDLQRGDHDSTFTMGDFQKDPGYQFRMDEGQKALERSASARGGLNSGGTMKALARYGQDFASNEYQNAYNRFNADRDQRFNKLSSLAGVGQVANSQINQAGAQNANNISSNLQAGANARAAGNIGGWNQIQGGIAADKNTMMQMAGMMASDERLKENIEPVSKADFKELANAIKPSFFNYKSTDFGDGDYIGVMAQDLEKTKLGKTLVFEDKDGNKLVDMNRAVMLLLANLGEAN